MKLFSARAFPIFAFLIIIAVFFWPFLIKGNIPLPADTIVGMYHPWRDQVWSGFKAGIPYKNFLITDPVRQTFVWKKLAIQEFKSFKLPLWNPYTHSGMPLLANFQTGAFYPLNFIFSIFSFNFSWGIYIVLQPLLALFFMYLLLKKYNLANIAALLGSITFAFGGFFTAWLEWGNIGHTLLWLPLIIFSLESLAEHRNDKKKYFLILLFSLISQFFAGHLQISIYILIFSLVYFIFITLSKQKIKENLKLVFIFLSFILITAIQWLPTLELILNSARDSDIVNTLNRQDWFLPAKHLVQLIVPDFFGNPATANYWGEWNYGEFVSFIGVIPFVFLLFSLKSFAKNSKIKFFWISLAVLLSFALATPWAKLPFIFKIPFLSTAQPSRLLAIIGFCFSVLSAFGLNSFITRKKSDNCVLLIAIGVLISLASLGFLLRFNVLKINFDYSQIAFRNLILPIVMAFLSILILFIENTLNNKLIKKALIYFLLLLALFDFYRFFTKFTPFTKQEWIFPKTKTIDFLQKDQSLFRIMTTDRRVLPANFTAIYGLQTISGYDPLYLTDYARLITKMESGQDGLANFQRIIEPANYSSNIADSLNVKYVISLNDIESLKLKKVFQEGETRIYKNLLLQPRARIISSSAKPVKVIEYKADIIKIKAESPDGGQLILADMFYPGWMAKINGKKVLIEKSNESFRKINLEKGLNFIEFYYEPKFLYFSILMVITGILTAIFVTYE